ncbi:MAG TPA: tetratricopeptide repeat protein [Tepidisphaeraceae bacterium]|jgi:predicted O-linked N-acetylglucosamine transferase (SPINDLY family)
MPAISADTVWKCGLIKALVDVDPTIQLALREHQAGRVAQAEAICREVLTHQPRSIAALQLLGQIAHRSGRHAEAVQCMRQVLTTDPANPYYLSNLGAVLAAGGWSDEAEAALRDAVRVKPDFAEGFSNLGNVLLKQGKAADAIEVYRRAVQLRPQAAESYYNLGTALHRMRRWEEAIAAYQKAIALRPDYPEAHNNLGSIHSENGQLDAGLAAFRDTLRFNPQHLEAMNNLAAGLQEKGELDESIKWYRKALQIKPDARIAGNMILAMHLMPSDDPVQIRSLVDQWNQTYARPLGGPRHRHDNPPVPERRLKIGYVSRDFNRAPVGRFLLPLLGHHDHVAVEVHCYSDVTQPDSMTQRMRGFCDHWRETAGMSDLQLSDVIHQDGIDILVDLGMHTKGSRILAFAYKPAPVQLSYLAYCSTTGLDAMDYRLTDPLLDPPGRDESVYSEKSIRLQSYWCYEAPAEAPAIGPLPCQASGQITFGCLNNYCKVTPGAFETWCNLLRRVSASRLMLHALEGDHRSAARERLALRGIDPSRIEFINRLPSAQYFQQYNQIDVALDPFPYPGGTTSCDALWMGVPVVTLAGRTAVARGGVSILSNIGLPELIAQSREQYVDIAAGLAGNQSRLTSLRSGLREQMRSSKLMNAPRFARDVESAYRAMWREWCRSKECAG